MWKENKVLRIFSKQIYPYFESKKQNNLINTPAKLIKPCTAIFFFLTNYPVIKQKNCFCCQILFTCVVYILPLLKLFPKIPYIEKFPFLLTKWPTSWEGLGGVGHNAFNIPKMHCTGTSFYLHFHDWPRPKHTEYKADLK